MSSKAYCLNKANEETLVNFLKQHPSTAELLVLVHKHTPGEKYLELVHIALVYNSHLLTEVF